MINFNLPQFHYPYHLWEDYKFGFYNTISGRQKDEKIKYCLEMFNSESLTNKYMDRVVNEWFYSCRINFTNPSVNKIAYLGQSACSLYANIPNTVTMEGWGLLTSEVKERSNTIAEKKIIEWFLNFKYDQLCIDFI
jgi:hypothetical protein